MAKITKATFKSMIAKNQGKLYIKSTSDFDGMVDCVMPTGDNSFTPIMKADRSFDNNLGYNGVWLVGGSRDYFTPFENDQFKGIEVYNCCGSFVVAVKK